MSPGERAPGSRPAGRLWLWSARANVALLVVVALLVTAGAAYGLAGSHRAPSTPPRPVAAAPVRTAPLMTVPPPTTAPTTTTPPTTATTTTTVPPTTTTTAPPPPTVAPTTAPPVTAPPPTTPPTTAPAPAPAAPGAHGPVTSPPLPAPGPGFAEGAVTAVGDSVMLDYQGALAQDVPGVNVQAAVSEQWSAGEAQLAQDKAAGQLGAVVIVGLSTNGPISSADFAAMMGILSGASRVVFVNIHVDQPWQDPNNAVLAAGVQTYPNTVLVDWYDPAQQNPGWLYSDQTHMPIDGPGAQYLASLVAQAA